MRSHLFVFVCLLAGLPALAGCDRPGGLQPPAVQVSGQGEVRVAPDMATLQFAISHSGTDLPALQQQAGRVMAEFLALTEELGIPEKQVQTSQLVIQPQYHWEDGQRIDDGYQVQRMITVELHQLDRLGRLIERAVALGINTVSPPELRSTRAGELRIQALRAAAENARQRAAALAEQLDARLGPVRRIDAADPPDGGPVPQQLRFASAEHAADSAQTYRTGEIVFHAEVRAEFALQ